MNPRQGRMFVPAALTAVAALTLASIVMAAGAPASPAAPAAKAAAPAAKSAAPAASAKLKVARLSMIVGNRAFPDFRDRVTVKLHESFRVGDSQYSAKVVEFQPDFAMDLKSHKIMSRSQDPNNPAVKVFVWKNGAPDDTSWAFLNMPPHYGRHSMLAFQLTRIEFENHAAVESTLDTTQITVKAGGHRP